jgi:hypothetical protein
MSEAIPVDSTPVETLAERVVSSLSDQNVRAMARQLFMAVYRHAASFPEFLDLIESWADTADFEADPAALQELRQNLEDIAKGAGVPWPGVTKPRRSR